MNISKSQRFLPATQESVFSAVERPEILAVWWGPKGFSCVFDNFEFKEDGSWTFEMVGPDGTKYLNECKFIRIVRPSQVVIRHNCDPYFTATLNIVESGPGSILEFIQEFDDPTILEKILPIIKPANEQLFDKLEKELAKIAITR